MSIKIKNLRISPYTQKDNIKVVFGDELKIAFDIPHVDGESFMCALDNERILYPINRPVCAYTAVFSRDGDSVEFTLNLTTSKLRDYVSSIRKPMPVWLQVVRAVGGKYETVVLDDILAIPSVIDGNMTVYEGDSFKELLDGKMDVPEAQGTAGQVLTLDEDGHYAWQDAQGGGDENVQSDWDCSDSESAAYILNKPVLATVATSGSYNDLTDKPVIPEQAQADWDESDSSEASFIKNKPTLFSGSYNDLTDKPNLANVATSGDYNDLTNKPIITQPVNADWDESDSESLAYILNKPNLATVATSGSYNDLFDKPVIPTQYDWLCLTANEANSTVYIYRYTSFDLEYSTDGTTWTTYTWDGMNGQTITLANAGDKVYWRGDNENTAGTPAAVNLYIQFRMTGSIKATGNVMSLLSKTCSKTEIPQFCFYQLFRGCSALTSANIFGGVKVLSGCGRIFQQCTNLTSIEIPTEVIVDHMDMMASAFNGCSSLSRVKVGFHTWFSGTVWFKNVAATGTFICPSDLDCSTRSTSRVPDGWTVERTSAPQADWNESDSSDPSYVMNKPDLSLKLDAPTTAGAVGQVLTKTENGQEWANTQNVDDPDTIVSLNGTITMFTSIVGELSNKNYFHITALEPSSVTFNYNYTDTVFEYSYDRREWFSGKSPITISLTTGQVVWFRNSGEPNSWDFVNSSLLSGVGGVSVGGELLSLASKSVDRTKVFTQGGRRLHYLFIGYTALKAIEPDLNLNINGFEGTFSGAFDSTGLTTVPDNFPIPEGVTKMDYIFNNCQSLTSIGNGFVVPNGVTTLTQAFYQCRNLVTIGNGFTVPNSVTSLGNMLGSCQKLTTFGNNVNINPGTNDEGNLDRSKITTIGTGFDYMTSYTTGYSSGQAVFPNATIGSGWKIYQYSDL